MNRYLHNIAHAIFPVWVPAPTLDVKPNIYQKELALLKQIQEQLVVRQFEIEREIPATNHRLGMLTSESTENAVRLKRITQQIASITTGQPKE